MREPLRMGHEQARPQRTHLLAAGADTRVGLNSSFGSGRLGVGRRRFATGGTGGPGGSRAAAAGTEGEAGNSGEGGEGREGRDRTSTVDENSSHGSTVYDNDYRS